MTAGRTRGTLAPLRVGPFGRLLTAYTVNELGDAVALVALAILVYDATASPLATAALFVATKFVPAFAATAVTARVDQLDVRRVLPALYVAEAAVFAVLALVASSFWLPLVLALGFLDGTLALVGRALTRGAVARTLATGEVLREGNALMNVGFAVASVGGAALGGLIASKSGVALAFWVDAASFLCVAVLVATARGLPAGHAHRAGVRARLREGLAHARRHARIRMLLGGQAVALLCFTLIVPIEIVYAKETLQTTDAGYGALLAAWGAGIVLGSAVYLGLVRRGLLGVVLAATAAVGLAYLGMSQVDDLWAACLLSVLGGGGNGIQWVAVVTAVQEATPADLQTRTVGLLESLGAAVPGVGFLLGGVLTSATSAPTTFAVAGCGILALVAAGAVVLRPTAGGAAPIAAKSGRAG